MWSRAEGTGTSLTNAGGGCVPQLFYLCGTSIVALEEGRCAHEQITQSGWDSDFFVGSSLVDMYAKFGRMEDAWKVFNKMLS
jgi:pentatricopeptide repeat protein